MTAENLQAAFEFIASDDYTVSIALAQYDPDEDGPTFRRLNISDTVAADLRLLAQRAARPFANQHRRGNLDVPEFDHDYVPSAHEIEYIDTNNDPIGDMVAVPSPAHITLIGDGDVEEFVSGVRFNVLLLSGGPHRVVLFRRYGPTKELSRSNKLITLFLGERLESIEEPTFQFDPNFDMLLYRDHLYIKSRANFEFILRYYDQLEAIAQDSLDAIAEHVPIANFDDFSDSCLGHLQKLKKLRNIAQKPYLADITVDDIRRTIENFDLNVEIDENDELVFDTADRWGILQLLDDAFLGSEMTGLRYETNSKREV
ncbi:MAG: DUF4868 domain-containing protein [Gammaproteobacteria bacterium]|nr:DUF4868 domain-containing protein [Gammaproteobacteria bacterium]